MMVDTYTWFITGSSRGIGLELVQQLVADSSNIVVAACRETEKAIALQSLKEVANGSLHILQLDINDIASIEATVGHVRGILGASGLDYLINNAGITEGHDKIFNFSPSGLSRTLQTNVVGPAILAQVLVPFLEKSKRKVIMNMSSGLASFTSDYGSVSPTYSISKTALNMLTYKQAKERPDLIVVAMCPGWVKTDMGGSHAEVEPKDSVAGMLRIITTATAGDSGKFYRWHGIEVPW